MRSDYERVFPDVSRIRTMPDAYRDVYPNKDGLWNNLVAIATGAGMIWLSNGILYYFVPCVVSRNGIICHAPFVSGVIYVYAFDYASTIVRFGDTSPKMRPYN